MLSAIIVLSFMAFLGMGVVGFLLARTTRANLEVDRLKALYLAEAGLAHSIHELKTDMDKDNNGLGNVLKTEFAGGSYKAFHNFQLSTITGVGEYNHITRQVQIKYTSL